VLKAFPEVGDEARPGFDKPPGFPAIWKIQGSLHVTRRTNGRWRLKDEITHAETSN
jgi:hypothetical protein